MGGGGDNSTTTSTVIPEELKPLYENTAKMMIQSQVANPLSGPSAWWTAQGRHMYPGAQGNVAGVNEQFYNQLGVGLPKWAQEQAGGVIRPGEDTSTKYQREQAAAAAKEQAAKVKAARQGARKEARAAGKSKPEIKAAAKSAAKAARKK